MKPVKLAFVLFGILLVATIILGGLLITNNFDLTSNNITQSEKDKSPIEVRSEYPDYDIEIVNEKLLRKELENIEFWEKGAVANYNSITNRMDAKKLLVILSPKVVDAFSVQGDDDQGNNAMEIGAKIDEDGNVVISVYVNPKYALDNQKPTFIDFGFWKGIYVLTQFKGGNSGSGKPIGDDFASGKAALGNIFEIKQK